MNFTKIIFIIGVLFLSANQVVALSYTNTLTTSSQYPSLSKNDLTAAKLLQSYVKSFQEKVEDTLGNDEEKHQTSRIIIQRQLRKMSESLSQIQNENVNPDSAQQVMESIVHDLKIINNRLRELKQQELKVRQEKLKAVKRSYIQIGNRISKTLDSLISRLSNQLLAKETLTKKEKSIVRSLVVIQRENNKIKSFSTLHFDSQEDMKLYFQKIIKTIRSELIAIKN